MSLLRRSRVVMAVIAAALIAAACSSGGSSTSSLSASPATMKPSSVTVTETQGQQLTVVPKAVAPGLANLQFANQAGPQSSNVLITLDNGTTMGQFIGHLQFAFGQQPKTKAQLLAVAAAMKWINDHARGYGGYPGTTQGKLSMQEVLPNNQYYVGDFGNGGIKKLDVSGHTGTGSLPAVDQSLKMVEPSAGMSRFAITPAPGAQPNTIHNGWLRVQNTTDELHQAVVFKVKPGSTNTQVLNAFKQNVKGPMLSENPVAGVDAMSPHVAVNINLQLSRGHTSGCVSSRTTRLACLMYSWAWSRCSP